MVIYISGKSEQCTASDDETFDDCYSIAVLDYLLHHLLSFRPCDEVPYFWNGIVHDAATILHERGEHNLRDMLADNQVYKRENDFYYLDTHRSTYQESRDDDVCE